MLPTRPEQAVRRILNLGSLIFTLCSSTRTAISPAVLVSFYSRSVLVKPRASTRRLSVLPATFIIPISAVDAIVAYACHSRN